MTFCDCNGSLMINLALLPNRDRTLGFDLAILLGYRRAHRRLQAFQ
jgi:hypothetical protein